MIFCVGYASQVDPKRTFAPLPPAVARHFESLRHSGPEVPFPDDEWAPQFYWRVLAGCCAAAGRALGGGCRRGASSGADGTPVDAAAAGAASGRGRVAPEETASAELAAWGGGHNSEGQAGQWRAELGAASRAKVAVLTVSGGNTPPRAAQQQPPEPFSGAGRAAQPPPTPVPAAGDAEAATAARLLLPPSLGRPTEEEERRPLTLAASSRAAATAGGGAAAAGPNTGAGRSADDDDAAAGAASSRGPSGPLEWRQGLGGAEGAEDAHDSAQHRRGSGASLAPLPQLPGAETWQVRTVPWELRGGVDGRAGDHPVHGGE